MNRHIRSVVRGVLCALAIAFVSLAASGCDRLLVPIAVDPDPVFAPIAWNGAYTDGAAIALAVQASATAVVPHYDAREFVSEFPSGFVDDLYSHDIALIGETHYMLEHQKLLVSLMKALQVRGWRAIGQELDYSIGIIVDDYVTGKRDSMPEWAFAFNRPLIQGIRAFNLTLPEADRVHLVYFDVEHSGQFLNVLYDHEAFRGDSRFTELFSLKGNESLDTYRRMLSVLDQTLVDDEASCRAAWGDLWYRRVVRMTYVELNSLTRRNGNPDDMLREDVIFSNVNALISEYGKILVNTGSAHAEKKAYMIVGNNEGKWLGVRLSALYGSRVWSVDVSAVKGSLPDGAYRTPKPFDLHSSCEGIDLMWIISDLYAGKLAYVRNIGDPLATRKIGVNHIVYVPGEPYDAELVYPEVSPIPWD